MQTLAGLHRAHKERLARLAPVAPTRMQPVFVEPILPPPEPQPQPQPEAPILPQASTRPTVEAVLRAVCQYCGITKAEITSNRSPAEIVWARQLATFAIKIHSKKTWKEIGRALGDRDHSTMLHAFRRVSGLITTDPEKRAALEAIEDSLRTAGYVLWGDTVLPDFELTHPAYIGA
jgi:hypothetical protein